MNHANEAERLRLRRELEKEHDLDFEESLGANQRAIKKLKEENLRLAEQKLEVEEESRQLKSTIYKLKTEFMAISEEIDLKEDQLKMEREKVESILTDAGHIAM